MEVILFETGSAGEDSKNWEHDEINQITNSQVSYEIASIAFTFQLNLADFHK